MMDAGRPVPIHASGPSPETRLLIAEIERLKEENVRLRERLCKARLVARNRGVDERRREADELLPFFTGDWEPLRAIADRSGLGSPSELASRARDLAERGLIETRWIGCMSIKEYRAIGEHPE